MWHIPANSQSNQNSGSTYTIKESYRMETIRQPLSRRNFIRLSSMTGAALSLGFYFPANGREMEVMKTETAENLGIDLNAWISIDTSSKVTITNHRAEMGQGSFQSVPQIIAEELE